MKYIEVKILTGDQGIEPLSSVLIGLGVTDLLIDDFEGRESSVALYLEDTDDGKKSLLKVISAVMELGKLHIEEKIVDDETWKDIWKEFFKPYKVSERIVIKPTWEEYKDNSGELVIELDPGMAFGTGTHPTTYMCIRLMEQYAGQFKSVLDIGCGSGILSITAALLGAADVLGIDNDDDAVMIAKENIELNGFSDKVKAVCGDLTSGISFKADMIVANLIADLIMLLSEDAHKNLTPGGLFISSGILIEKLEEVKTAVKNAGFEIIDILEEDEWCAILARLRKNGI